MPAVTEATAGRAVGRLRGPGPSWRRFIKVAIVAPHGENTMIPRRLVGRPDAPQTIMRPPQNASGREKPVEPRIAFVTMMLAAMAIASAPVSGLAGDANDGGTGADAPNGCTPGPVAPFLVQDGGSKMGNFFAPPTDQKDLWSARVFAAEGHHLEVTVAPSAPLVPLYAGVRPPGCGPLLVTSGGPFLSPTTLEFDSVAGPGIYKIIVGVWPPPDFEEGTAASTGSPLGGIVGGPAFEFPLTGCGHWCYFVSFGAQPTG